jgi:hypothetical protein
MISSLLLLVVNLFCSSNTCSSHSESLSPSPLLPRQSLTFFFSFPFVSVPRRPVCPHSLRNVPAPLVARVVSATVQAKPGQGRAKRISVLCWDSLPNLSPVFHSNLSFIQSFHLGYCSLQHFSRHQRLPLDITYERTFGLYFNAP